MEPNSSRKLRPLAPAEPTESISALLAAIVHGYAVRTPKPGDDFEELTVVERPQVQS